MSSSAARAWRFTAGSGLTRTLGSVGKQCRASAKSGATQARPVRSKKSGEFRGFDAGNPNMALAAAHWENWSPCVASGWCTAWEAWQFFQSSRAAARNARHGAALRWRLEHVVRRQQQRGAGGTLFRRARLRGLKCAAYERGGQGALPNPSFNRSPNGRPPGPVCGALHSPQPGPGVLPLVPG